MKDSRVGASAARHATDDLARWIAYNGLLRLHPDALRTIRRSLAPLGIPVDVEAAWRGGLNHRPAPAPLLHGG